MKAAFLLQDQIRHHSQHAQVHRVEPVKGLLLQRTARAPLPVVEPDQHKGQRGGELPGKQHGSHDALPLAVATGQVQRTDDEHTDAVVVRTSQMRRKRAACRTQESFPAGRAVRLFKMLQTCHGQHAQRQRPVNILMVQCKGRAEKCKVKGHLTDEGKQEQPPDVFFHIAGMYKALHQQKTEQGKGQPPGEAQHHVQPVQWIGGKGVPREGADVQPGRKDTCLDAGRADVVHQHGDAGNGFKGGAAEAAARGKCGHKKTPRSVCKKSLQEL